jgi:hypothetical protein
MIRFVYIGDQINADQRAFAFFDTVLDRFVSIADEQVFDTLDDLRAALAVDAASALAHRRHDLVRTATLALTEATSERERERSANLRELVRSDAEAYQLAIRERDEARATARVLAHAYTTDNRPPGDLVKQALAYPVRP